MIYDWEISVAIAMSIWGAFILGYEWRKHIERKVRK
jgi:hypothetical protein